MKRIKFLPPFDFLTGNISGAQDLLYPSNNNKAFYSPLGEVNYAENYQPRFIAYQIRLSNKRYFNVRTRSAFHATTRAMKAISLLGGVGAMYASLLNNKATTTYEKVHAQWVALQELGMTDTFRQYVMKILRQMIVNHAEDATFAGPVSSPVTVSNPWFEGTQTAAFAISNSILVKFWPYLADNGRKCTIDDATCIFKAGDTWAELQSSNYDVLNIQSAIAYQPPLVTMNGRYIKNSGGAYVNVNMAIVAEEKYTTTDVQP